MKRTAWNKGIKGLQPWMNTSGLNNKGGIPWNKGKAFSQESKEKMSEAQKKRFSLGSKHPMLGKKHSNKTKEHWSKIRKGIDWRKPETVIKIKEEWSKRRGEEVHNWKGGVTVVHRTVRTMPEYYKWRTSVFERDGFTCQECKQKGKRINADHIIPFSFILEQEDIKNRYDARACEFLWNIENGRTLCVACHKNSPSTQWRTLAITLNALKQQLRELSTD